jgi:hypothetical protein
MPQVEASTFETLKLLVTCKTYPHPSVRYQETVFTAGITEDGRWIRLYPVRFRYWEEKQQYSLYDWIALRVRKRPVNKDKRKESFEPAGEITIAGHVGTGDNWAERKGLILPHARASVEELLDGYSRDGESLGIIRPAGVTDVTVERETADWPPREKAALAQQMLFGRQPRPLEKMPYRFSYCFRCDDARCTGHKMQITDWGLCYLFLKTRRDEGEREAIQKTKQKCWELVAEVRDAYLYLGTVYPKPSFIVVGMFYPKREPSSPLWRLPFR